RVALVVLFLVAMVIAPFSFLGTRVTRVPSFDGLSMPWPRAVHHAQPGHQPAQLTGQGEQSPRQGRRGPLLAFTHSCESLLAGMPGTGSEKPTQAWTGLWWASWREGTSALAIRLA